MTINSLQPTVFSRQLQEVFENPVGNTQAKYASLLTAESRKPKADERIDKMDTEKQEKTEVKVHFLSIDRSTGAPIVVLKEKESEANRILLIWIGESEAAAIQMHLENIEFPRPMTHDLLKTMIERFDAKVADVCVNAVEQTDERWTFYAHLTVNMNGETVQVDCRPSDAIALAIRCEVPIYVAEDVIAGHGFSEQELGTGQKDDTKDALENLDDDTLKQFTV